MLSWAAWFAVTFNLSLDSAECLIKRSAFGRQERNARAALQLQYVGVWGLCYIQMKWLFLFNSCLNIVWIMEYLVEQKKLALASSFIPVVTRCFCIYNLAICYRVEFGGCLGIWMCLLSWVSLENLKASVLRWRGSMVSCNTQGIQGNFAEKQLILTCSRAWEGKEP